MPLKLPERGYGKYLKLISIMETERLSLKSIKNVLSRAEMKKIMAGSGGGCGTCNDISVVCCSCYTGQYPSSPYFIYCGGHTCSAFCESTIPGTTGAHVSCSFCG
jgi:hypothetical protein